VRSQPGQVRVHGLLRGKDTQRWRRRAEAGEAIIIMVVHFIIIVIIIIIIIIIIVIVYGQVRVHGLLRGKDTQRWRRRAEAGEAIIIIIKLLSLLLLSLL
jgi:hypothetical protein